MYYVYIWVNFGYVELCLGFFLFVVLIFWFYVGCVFIVFELVDFMIYNRWFYDWIYVYVIGEVLMVIYYFFIFVLIENLKKIIFY